MTDVIIAGIGQTGVGESWDISLRELALMAIELKESAPAHRADAIALPELALPNHLKAAVFPASDDARLSRLAVTRRAKKRGPVVAQSACPQIFQ